MSHKTIIATAATVVGISALTSTAVFAHGGGGLAGGGHFGGGAYSVPHMPMTSMARPAAFQSVGKFGAPPTTSTRTAPPPRFLDKAPAAQPAPAAPKNPIQKALDAAKQSAQQAEAAPKNPIQKALDAAKQSAQAAAAPKNPIQKALDAAKQSAQNAEAAPKNPIQKALDAAKQSAQNAEAAAAAKAKENAKVGQAPTGTPGGKVADQIPTPPPRCAASRRPRRLRRRMTRTTGRAAGRVGVSRLAEWLLSSQASMAIRFLACASNTSRTAASRSSMSA